MVWLDQTSTRPSVSTAIGPPLSLAIQEAAVWASTGEAVCVHWPALQMSAVPPAPTHAVPSGFSGFEQAPVA